MVEVYAGNVNEESSLNYALFHDWSLLDLLFDGDSLKDVEVKPIP
jgi:hypothetical protein